MGALNALQRSPGALARNPVLVIPVLIIGLFLLPELLLQATNPLLATTVSIGISFLFIFILPLFQGGIIGMADEALQGRTRLSTFIADGKGHYVNLLIAYILFLVITFGLLFVFFIISFIMGMHVFPPLDFSGYPVSVLDLAFFIGYLPMLLFFFFIQFYGHAIVLNNEGAVDGMKKSFSLVWQNLLSTLGYSVIAGALGLVLGGLSMLVSPQSAQFTNLQEVAFPTLAAAIIVGIVLASIIGSGLAIFSVAFYREISS